MSLPHYTIEFKRYPFGQAVRETAFVAADQHEVLSTFKYIVHPNDRLEVLTMDTRPDFRKRGLSKHLARAALERFPNVTSVRAGLIGDNADVVNRFIRIHRLSCLEAIKKTPYYKTFKDLGFTDISDFECTDRFHLATLYKAN